MAAENQKPKPGGISFDVILKPASVESVRSPLQLSPNGVEKRELSQEQIENKLKRAEERRSLIEQEQMEQLAKERQKAIEDVTKAQSESEEFSKKTTEKLLKSIAIHRENSDTQIKALQERVRECSLKVDKVHKAGYELIKSYEAKKEQNRETKVNRQNQLKLVKLQERESHINEVCQASENRGQSTDELLEQHFQKMENALRDKEEEMTGVQDILSKYEHRIKGIQEYENKLRNTGEQLNCMKDRALKLEHHIKERQEWENTLRNTGEELKCLHDRLLELRHRTNELQRKIHIFESRDNAEKHISDQ